MHQKILGISILLGLLIFILVGCASQSVEPDPTETVSVPQTSEPEAHPTLLPVDTPTALPLEEEDPGQESEPVTISFRFVIVPEHSEARYRVQEQLAGFSLPNDAVGRTQAISGMVVIDMDGSIDPSQSVFEVDLSTLTSDRSQRDNYLRNNTLRTNQFPMTVFVPGNVSGLPEPLPQSGEISFNLIGDLTILDVTKPVEWEVVGDLQGDVFSGSATTSFTFDYFELVQPRVASVLSIEDDIGLEVDFTLQRVDN
ncbi:MAG: YceI family protein [Anaerolineales bacterium]|nr:YceI family protein [Anaerolineales bacterium]